MIINISNAEIINDFLVNYSGDPFVCKINTLLLSYQTKYNFTEYWVQLDDKKKIVSLISRYYCAYTVFMTQNSDTDEISYFINMSYNVKSVIFDGKYNLKLDKLIADNGVILKNNNTYLSENKRNITSFNNEFKIITPDLNDAFELLKVCNSKHFSVPDYESFYLDTSHKLRHNLANLCGIKINEKLVGCAMTVAQTNFCAVIGAVAVHPNYRKIYIGKTMINYLNNKLFEENKTVYVFRDKQLNKEFYKSCGFCEYKTFTEYLSIS